MKSENYKKWQANWQKALMANVVSNTYGPYTQGISLQIKRNYVDAIGLNTFQPKIVHRNLDSLPKLKSTWSESAMQQQKLSPNFLIDSASTFISEDEVAKALALEHDVDMVVTSDTLETFLKHPEAFNTNWCIPISYINVGTADSQSLVLFLENPLPSVATPRECLSVGTQEALISHAIHSTGNTVPSLKGEDVYTLLNINRPDRHQKVLVRSRNYLVNQNSQPTLIFSKLDYFAKHGLEEYTAHERAVWLLHKMLQGDSHIFVGRVDVTNMHILNFELKGVAEALTPLDPSTSERHLDTLGQFEMVGSNEKCLESLFGVMVDILSSVSLIAKKTEVNHMLCYPGRKENAAISSIPTVTVHSNQNVNDIFIDVTKELEEKATAVLLNEHSLRSCFRLLQWKHDRLPYTFTVRDQNKN